MSVTTDLLVLQKWPKVKHAVSSAQVAAALGLTVFQVTARLKGMKDRGFLDRTPSGDWFPTKAGLAERDNPSPSLVKTAPRLRDPATGAVGAPDDSKIPRLQFRRDEWAPGQRAVEDATKRLPAVEERLKFYRHDAKRYRREIMALQVEYDHCRKVLDTPRKKRWSHRHDGATTFFIAPDGREYVEAKPFETADLLVISETVGIPETRLRLYATSHVAKKDKKDEKVELTQQERTDAKKQEARNERIVKAEEAAAAVAEAKRSRSPEFHPDRDRERKPSPRRKEENGKKRAHVRSHQGKGKLHARSPRKPAGRAPAQPKRAGKQRHR